MKTPNSINCSILEKEYRLERFYTKWLDLFPIIPGINTLAQNMYLYEWSNATIGNFSWYEFHQRSAKAYGIKDLKQHIKDLKDQIEYEKRQLEIIVVDKKFYDSTKEVDEFLDFQFDFRYTLLHLSEIEKVKALLLFYNFCLGDNSIWSDLVLWESNNLEPIRGQRSKEYSYNQEMVYKMAMVGKTQVEIAKILGMTQQMVSKHWKRSRAKSDRFYKGLLVSDPKVKIKTEEDSWKKIERDDFFVANTWEIEYKTKPNIEIEMTDEEKELEKQADELLKNATQ